MATHSSSLATPAPIEAKQLHHPGRWIAAAILLLIATKFVWSSATNEAYHWDTYFAYLLDTRVAVAALHTLEITILAMLIGVVLGAILAVLRMSPNPVLRAVSLAYLWVFRGTPVYVQLVFWGLLSNIYKFIDLGFTQISLETMLSNAFFLAVIGLGLNESAYMAEIVRAGTVLPQAMRIIIPPTGNELISMLKTTSLVVAIPYTLELYGRSMDIANNLFLPVPMLLVAATWYLVITSLLMVGQHYLEGFFSKGASRQLTARQLAALADAEGKPPANVTITDEN